MSYFSLRANFANKICLNKKKSCTICATDRSYLRLSYFFGFLRRLVVG